MTTVMELQHDITSIIMGIEDNAMYMTTLMQLQNITSIITDIEDNAPCMTTVM